MHEQYREKNRWAKRTVVVAKDRARKYQIGSLQSNEGRTKMFKIVKQMRKERKDIVGLKYVRDENGALIAKEEKVVERQRRYFSSFLNETNE